MEERSSFLTMSGETPSVSRRTSAGDPGLQQSDPKYLSFYSQYQLYDNAVLAGRMQNEEDWALLDDYMQDNVSGLHINENGMYFWKRTGIASARRITLPIL